MPICYLDGSITKVFYEKNREGSTHTEDTEFSDLMHVKPHVVYTVKLEALRSDLGDLSEMLKEIWLNDNSFGECNPPSLDLLQEETPSPHDYECDFFECSFDQKEIVSSSGTIKIQIKYKGNSYACNCDTSTWKCYDKRENTSPALTKMIAATRITLFPQVHRSGNICI